DSLVGTILNRGCCTMQKKAFKKLGIYALLVFVANIMIGPFLWLLSTALKSGGENIFAYPPKLIPEHLTFMNFVKVFSAFPFWTYLLNSTIVTTITVILNVLLCSLAAYPLARMKFKGRNVIFVLVLCTYMLPFQLLMVPIYIFAVNLCLQNTYADLFLPHISTAFGIFLTQQTFIKLPYEIAQSASIDRATSYQLRLRNFLPLVLPYLPTLAIFEFVLAWDHFIRPLIITSDHSKYTLPLGLNMLTGPFASD